MNRPVYADLPISPTFPHRHTPSPLQALRVQHRHFLLRTREQLIRRGFLWGTYEWRVRNYNFPTNIIVKSKTFHISGAEWKLALLPYVFNGRSEGLDVCLFSCNKEGVSADTVLTVAGGGRITPSVSEMMSTVAYPFQCIARHRIHFYPLMAYQRHLHLSSTLTVTADLKNVQEEPEDNLRPLRDHVRKIDVEIIGKHSIRRILNTNRAFGIVSPVRQRHSNVYSCSSISLWAQHKPDSRYWLCQRSDENVIIRICLDNMGIFKCFGDIEGNESVITLFEEKRTEAFEPVSNNRVIIFVKLYEPPEYKDLTYFGHMQAQRTSRFLDLQDRIEAKLPDLFFTNGYHIYLEKEGHHLRDITNNRLTVEECGILSGSIIIVLRKRALHEIYSARDVQRAMRFVHRPEPELNEGSQIELIVDPGSESNHFNDPNGPAAMRSISGVQGARGLRLRSLPDLKWIFLAGSVHAISSLLEQSFNCGVPLHSRPDWRSLSLNAGASAASFLLRRVLNPRRFRGTPVRLPFDWKFVFLGAGACAFSFLLGRASNSHRSASQTSFSVSLLPASGPRAGSVVHGQHLNDDRIQALLLLYQASLASFASIEAPSPELVFSVRVRRDGT